MAFHVTHATGRDEIDPPLATLPALLAELHAADSGHGCVSLTHDSEWCLSAFHGGDLTFEHVEEEGPVHMQHVPEKHILELWRSLAQGDIEYLQTEAWLPGCPP